VTRWVVAHRVAWLTHAMRFVTVFGGSAFLIPLVVVAGVALRRRRGTWAPLWFLAAAYGGAFVGNNVGKRLFSRARPPLATRLVPATGYALPSGHAFMSAAVYGALAVVLMAPGGPLRRRRAARFAAGAVVALIGVSRVYLGVHWTTDVVSGWLLGLLWLRLLVQTRLGRRVRRVRIG
jgi:membrane-associated phospholipid phosphatase